MRIRLEVFPDFGFETLLGAFIRLKLHGFHLSQKVAMVTSMRVVDANFMLSQGYASDIRGGVQVGRTAALVQTLVR